MSKHGQPNKSFFCIESGIDQIALQGMPSQRGGKSMAKHKYTGSAPTKLRVQYRSSTGELFFNGVRMGVFEGAFGEHPDAATIDKAVRGALSSNESAFNWRTCRLVNNLTGEELREEDSDD